MDQEFDQNSVECRATQAALSDYVDNALSAHRTWEVERHLSACKACSTQAHQLQATVGLLHAADRHDTGDDFMAKLHARLDTLSQQPDRRRSPGAALLDWLSGLPATLQARRAPVLSLGMAVAGLAIVILLYQPQPAQPPMQPPVTASRQVQQALEQQVATTASDPLGDAAAEKLTANIGSDADSAGGITE